MKLKDMALWQKILAAIGILCFWVSVYLTIFQLFRIWPIPKAIPAGSLGAAWLCLAIIQKGQKIAILYYLVAAVNLLAALLYCF